MSRPKRRRGHERRGSRRSAQENRAQARTVARRRRLMLLALAAVMVVTIGVLGIAGAFTSTHNASSSNDPVSRSIQKVFGGPQPPPLPTRDMPLDPEHQIHPVFPTPPHAALVFDFNSQTALWRLNDFQPMPIASLTKLMTALLVVQHTHPDDPVTIAPEALNVPGSGVPLQTVNNQPVSVETLLQAMLIHSANDAATALAIHVAGSQPAFVTMMNQQARDWHLDCTTYVSPHGLEPQNVSCAADLSVLARLAMRQSRIADIVKQARDEVPYPNQAGHLVLDTTNPLLRVHYPGTIGLKTGTTNEAGDTYVAVADRNSHTLGVVLLNSPNRTQQASLLLDQAFQAEGVPPPPSPSPTPSASLRSRLRR